MDAAALPGGAQHLGDGRLEALVGIGDHQLDAPQAPAREAAQEVAPEGLGLGRADGQDLASSLNDWRVILSSVIVVVSVSVGWSRETPTITKTGDGRPPGGGGRGPLELSGGSADRTRLTNSYTTPRDANLGMTQIATFPVSSNLPKSLGEEIVARRRHLGPSRKRLARKLSMDEMTLARIEAGSTLPKDGQSNGIKEFLSTKLLSTSGKNLKRAVTSGQRCRFNRGLSSCLQRLIRSGAPRPRPPV